MNKKIKKVILLIILALAAFALWRYFVGRPEGPEPVRTTGVVEAIEVSIASKIPGKLRDVRFREGDRVKAGELIATVESEDLRAAREQAEASARAAEATLASGYDVIDNARAQVRVAQAEVSDAKARIGRQKALLAQAELDYGRAKELFDRGIVARSDLDSAKTARDTAQAELASAKAGLELAASREVAARAALKKAVGDMKTLAARVEEARGAVRFSQAQLGYAEIPSPIDGVVEYRSLEGGEVVAPGESIMTLIDPASLWVRIDLEQRFVDRVRVGEGAKITLEDVPGRAFEGTVYDIGRMGEFATERDVTRGRQDIKTFRTRIRVKDPEGVLKPGMTVVVEIP